MKGIIMNFYNTLAILKMSMIPLLLHDNSKFMNQLYEKKKG